MTILHVFPTFAVGGSQMRFAALANRFGRRYRHVIVAMDGNTECRQRLHYGLDVTFIDAGRRPRDTFSSVQWFRALLQKLKPERLVTYNWGSIECAVAGAVGLVPHIHIEDGFGPEEASGQLLRRVMTRRFVLRRSTVVLPSQNLFRLARDVWRLPVRALRYIPNGVDCARFGKPGIVPLPMEGVGPVIGTVAALRPEKNVPRLVEAFALVRRTQPCQLLIVGDGPERAGLEKMVRAMGLSGAVTFTGYRNDTERAYAAMSVLALSSDTEQMPTSVLEAMAAGLPVVSTDVGDVGAMVSDANRPFIVAQEVKSLADGLQSLLGAPLGAREIGMANQSAARRHFDHEQMFAAYDALFGGAAITESRPLEAVP